jgi:hypothetical protein
MIETDITRYRGDTALVRVEVIDTDSAVVDIAGCTFLLTVDPQQYPTTGDNNVFQISGTIVGDGSTGLVDFAIPGTSSPGVYYYDVQMTTAGGKIETIARGKWTILQDITK